MGVRLERGWGEGGEGMGVRDGVRVERGWG